MKQKDVLQAVSRRTGYTQREVKKVLETVFDVIVDGLNDGESVRFKGFGAFQKVKKAERKRYDFTNGEMVDVPERIIPTFKAGNLFIERMKK